MHIAASWSNRLCAKNSFQSSVRSVPGVGGEMSLTHVVRSTNPLLYEIVLVVKLVPWRLCWYACSVWYIVVIVEVYVVVVR